MSSTPAKAIERIKNSLKHFQPILQSAKTRDVNESDTVTIVKDILEHTFGYDKYAEISSEHAVRGTYCDLAIRLDGTLVLLIEAKAIGLELKTQHLKQAVDYAANQGLDWVGLTNGAEWRIYKVTFGKPINFDLVLEFNLLDISLKDQVGIQKLALIAKEGWQKDRLEEYNSVKQILNKFVIGSILNTDSVVDVIRRELKRLSSEVKFSGDDVRKILQNEVIKREVLEGEKAQQAQKQIAKAGKRSLRKIQNSQNENNGVNKDEDVEIEVTA